LREISLANLSKAQIILVAVDVTHPEDELIAEIIQWLQEIEIRPNPDWPERITFLVGLKADTANQETRQLSFEQIHAIAADRGLKYLEASSFDGTGVDEVVETAVGEFLENTQGRAQPASDQHVDVDIESKKTTKSCSIM